MVFTLRREESQRLCGALWDLLVSSDFVREDFTHPGKK